MNLVNDLIYKLVNDLAYGFMGVLFEIPRFARNDNGGHRNRASSLTSLRFVRDDGRCGWQMRRRRGKAFSLRSKQALRRRRFFLLFLVGGGHSERSEESTT